MTARIEVLHVGRLGSDAPKVVNLPQSAVAVFRLGDRIAAIDDRCVRCGKSLAAGTVAGSEVTCACCGWAYDLATGAVRGVPSLTTVVYEAVLEDDRLLLRIPFSVA